MLNAVTSHFFMIVLYLQVRLQVNDGGIPSKYNTAMLTVTVLRNLFAPVINPLEYNVTIYEDQVLGEEIERVFATDQDSRSPHNDVRYEAQESFSGNALNYFAVRETDGVVYVRRSLRDNNFQQTSFTVSTEK